MVEETFCKNCPASHLMGDGSRQCRLKAPTVSRWQFVDDDDWCLDGRALMQAMEMDRLRQDMIKVETRVRALLNPRFR